MSSPTTPGAGGRPRITRAAAQTYGASLGGAVLSLANVLVVARALGASGRGEVAFVTTVAFLTSTVAAFSVQESMGNLAGTDPHLRPALATNASLFAVCFGLLANAALILLFVAVPASAGDASALLLGLTLAAIPLLILEIYLRTLVQADYGFTVTNVTWVVPIVLNLVINGTLALAGRLTVTSAVCTWIGGQVLATLLLAWCVQTRLAGFGRPNRALARRSVAFGARSHVGNVMVLGNDRLGVWLLAAFDTSAAVGVYSVAIAWTETLSYLPTTLAAVQRPDLVRATRTQAGDLAARLFRIGLLVTAAIAAALAVAAPVLCVGLFGEEFRGAIPQLRVLALAAFGIVALKQLTGALTAQRLPLHASFAIGTGFVASLVLGFMLIPATGGIGAAWATTTACTVGGLASVLVFARALNTRAPRLTPRPQDVSMLARELRGLLGH